MKTNNVFLHGFLLIAVSLFFHLKVIAQVSYGPVAGINFSDLKGDFESEKLLGGAHLGGLINIPVRDNFRIEPHLLFSSKGAYGASDNFNLYYLELPVWLRYQLPVGLHFNLGPYAGFLLAAKNGEQDEMDNLKDMDWGVCAGAGFQFENGFGLMAGYQMGISNIVFYERAFDGEDASLKNRTIKITASYSFGY